MPIGRRPRTDRDKELILLLCTEIQGENLCSSRQHISPLIRIRIEKPIYEVSILIVTSYLNSISGLNRVTRIKVLRWGTFAPAFGYCAATAALLCAAAFAAAPLAHAANQPQDAVRRHTVLGCKEIAEVFTRVYPEFRQSTDLSCPVSPSSDPQAAAGKQCELVFYSVTAKPAFVQISVEKTNVPNAFAYAPTQSEPDSGRIVLTSRLLSEFADLSELAFVLGHEMSHLEHNHRIVSLDGYVLSAAQLDKIHSVHQAWELEADRESLARISAAGYDKNSPAIVLGRLGTFETRGGSNLSGEHPLIAVRIAELTSEHSAETAAIHAVSQPRT